MAGQSADGVSGWLAEKGRPLSHVSINKHRQNCMGLPPGRGRPKAVSNRLHLLDLIGAEEERVQDEERPRCQCGARAYRETFLRWRPEEAWRTVLMTRCTAGCEPMIEVAS